MIKSGGDADGVVQSNIYDYYYSCYCIIYIIIWFYYYAKYYAAVVSHERNKIKCNIHNS